MLQLTLVRHGSTAWNAEERCQGYADIPLNDTGRAQAAAVADALRAANLTAVYASDLSRARETAESIAAPHGLPVQTHAGLRELHQGELEGRLIADLLREYADLMQQWFTAPGELTMPGGESLGDLQTRAWDAMESIIAAHDAGHVVVVSHSITIRCILARALDLDMRAFRRFLVDLASLSHLEVNGRWPGIVLRGLNEVGHLDGLAVEPES